MSVQLQTLSISEDSHTPIIILHTENARVLFDAGEGAQRLAVEHKVRIGKISHVLLTSHYPCSLGGLPGFLLTAFDAGVHDVQIVGSLKAEKYLQSTNYFMRPFSNFSSIDHSSPKQVIVDGVTLDAVPIIDKVGDVSKISYVGRTADIVGKFLIDKAYSLGVPKGPLFGKLKSGHSVTLASGAIVHPSDVLDPTEKGKYFAVISALEAGEDDCYELNELTNHGYWKRFQTNVISEQEERHAVHTMLHLSNYETIEAQSYLEWMKSFGEGTRHIFLGEGCCHARSSFLASSMHYYCLRSIMSSDSIEKSYSPAENKIKSAFIANHVSNGQYIPATALMKVTIAPDKKIGSEDVLSSSLAVLSDLKNEVEQRIDALKPDLSGKITATSSGSNHGSAYDDDQILFLGTGCAIPSKYRNVSGIIYYIPASRSAIMMDVGEGSWYQLLNIRSKINEIGYLYNLTIEERKQRWAEIITAVWISHAHADHHLGLITVTMERKKYLQKSGRMFSPLLVIAPTPVIAFLNDMSDSVYPELQGAYTACNAYSFNPFQYCNPCSISRGDSLGSTDEQVDNLSFDEAQPQQAKKQKIYSNEKITDSEISIAHASSILKQIGIDTLQAVPVIHCPQAYGLVFARSNIKEDVEGIKIVYSGDTRPCEELVTYGAGARVLIHEATFEDDKQEEAVQKRHTTIAEAIEVGKRMCAEHIILTHFSQRYNGVPEQLMQYYNNSPISCSNVTVASDFLCLNLTNLRWSPHLTPALYSLFPPSECVENSNEELKDL